MTVQSVIQEVCAVIGVRPPNGSVFVSPYVDRTAWELLQLANEIAQRIAFDTREWQMIREKGLIAGSGVEANNLPANFQRMLKSAQLWRSSNTSAPVSFISDADDWLRKELQGYVDPMGEWMIEGGKLLVRPALAAAVVGPPAVPAETVKFYYLRNTIVRVAPPATPGTLSPVFTQDLDTFVLPERVLKLGMIWQWKANKGASYAEDLANYEDALNMASGADKPSPIIVGSRPVSSSATIAYWGPVPPPSTFVGPGP